MIKVREALGQANTATDILAQGDAGHALGQGDLSQGSTTTSGRSADCQTMGIYIHIPFCRIKCRYCDFPSYQNLNDYYDWYIDALCMEIKDWYGESRSKRSDESLRLALCKKPVSTIYVGGGTPSQLSLEQWDRLVRCLEESISLTADYEWTVEMNPGDGNELYLTSLRDYGVNRLSLGVQTFDDGQLEYLRRGHTAAQARETIAMAQGLFPKLSADLIYGLPGQDLQAVQFDAEHMVGLGLSHISVYGLQVEDGTLLARDLQEGLVDVPKDDLLDEMYDYVTTYLPSQGLRRYEISNYGKPGHESQHNMRYWRYEPYFGFGAGAHGFYGNRRYFHSPYVVPYIQSVDRWEELESEDISDSRHREDYCFLALRLAEGLSAVDYERRFGESLEGRFHQAIDSSLAEGLLRREGEAYVMTDEGWKHGNYVFAKFIE